MRRLFILINNILAAPYRILFTHISMFVIMQDAIFDKTSAIASGVKFYRGKIGRYSYINRNSFVTDTDIGNFCSIGSGCEIGGTSHPLDWVSTSPVFHKWENIMKKNFARNEYDIFHRTYIGNDVWIGSNCLIKAGVRISDGAVIGMGSVLTKNVGAYEIWAGNPAKCIRKRFDQKTIEELLYISWWNWNDKEIEKHSNEFSKVKAFISEYYKMH